MGVSQKPPIDVPQHPNKGRNLDLLHQPGLPSFSESSIRRYEETLSNNNDAPFSNREIVFTNAT